ncbi:MAG: hypothetical protein HY247_07535 [archaeon]|nr:MAG: hypothetical protein HY247_07535 [archaeon]
MIDFSIYASLAALFGVAAQFQAMGGEEFLRRFVASFEGRVGIVFAVVAVSSLFSPFILNDVVIVILTPVVVKFAKHFAVDVAPLLVAEIAFTNIASSVSPFGNPQNILLWSASGLSVSQFVEGAWLPLVASGGLACVVLLPFAKRVGTGKEFPTAVGSSLPAVYLVLVAAVVLAGDSLGLGPSVALGLAFLSGFLFNRNAARGVAAEFDLRSLITLWAFVGLTTVAGYFLSGSLRPLAQPAAEGVQPYSGLFMGLVSNLIGNVPATQLILGVSTLQPWMAPKIAVEAGLAGNIGPIGSFANILALQIARRSGAPIKRTLALQFLVGILGFVPALF